MTINTPPSLEQFLAAPLEEVRCIAPATVILGTGGTRRRAVLAGVSPQSDAYASWTRQEMLRCFDLIFSHGVQHLVSAMLVAGHAAETTPGYREHLTRWTAEGLAGQRALEDYARLGWRVRLIGVESWPELQPAAERLLEATSHIAGPTLWASVASSSANGWQQLLHTAVTQGITDRAALVRALYGEEIPPATLYLGSGKPQVDDSLIPPLLVGKLECYWRQHLGYDLDVTTLRTILYDYAYIRPTWRADKSGRAEMIHTYAAAWEKPPVLGLGTRLGPFWYPAPTADPHETLRGVVHA
jgi:hypothetical protein